MNKNIFKAHLEELLKQLSSEEIYNSKEIKARLLLVIETEIEMCDLINNKFQKNFSKEKEFFIKIQELVLLDEFVQAINYINKELEKIDEKDTTNM